MSLVLATGPREIQELLLKATNGRPKRKTFAAADWFGPEEIPRNDTSHINVDPLPIIFSSSMLSVMIPVLREKPTIEGHAAVVET